MLEPVFNKKSRQMNGIDMTLSMELIPAGVLLFCIHIMLVECYSICLFSIYTDIDGLF